VRDGLELLVNLSHRSARGGDAETGDGAGILLQLPHAFLRAACRVTQIRLPEAGEYGVGMVFLPTDEQARRGAERTIESAIHAYGCRLLGWRDVPVDATVLGGAALSSLPVIRQFFVAQGALDRDVDDSHAFERTLYCVRRALERSASEASPEGQTLYVASLSSRTVVYKGLLRPDQLSRFYRDLSDPEIASGLALVHSRFSTNTFPSWPLAHPYRFLCHNGEINTLRGNVNWMRVREEQLASSRFSAMRDLFPIVQPGQSDSASLDNVVELLVHSGRPLAHAMMMLMPEAWERDAAMPADRHAFYEYHASLMEPWDGPAAVAFTDGRQIGAIQDRNGLRPARWILTDDDRVILASEAGALPVAASRIVSKGRLQPGRLLLVNTVQGKLLSDDDVKADLASLRPYRRWVAEQRVNLDNLASAARLDTATVPDAVPLRRRQAAFGYTREELSMVLAPMASAGEEPTGSMGNDAPLAVLSDRPQLLFSYFRQLFAQVTNPAIDPLREQLVMSLGMYLGPHDNLLDETPAHARQVRVEHPVLTAQAMSALRALAEPGLRTVTLPAVFRAADGAAGLGSAVEALCQAASRAVESGAGVLILSDRGMDREWGGIPSLLAVAAVHHHLIREGCRSRAGIVVEAGDAREVSHVALLISYGAAAVHPWLALSTCAELARSGLLMGVDEPAVAEAKYIKAVEKGLLKILSKMGISTLQSYCGAQIWEAVGVGRALVDRHFAGTPSRIGGIDLAVIGAEALSRHQRAFDDSITDDDSLLDVGGDYHYRIQGERHNWNPRAITALQRATRENSATTYREFSRAVHDEQHGDATLRGLLDFATRDSVPIEEVEPAAAIVRRFATGAMSFGSISREAHETLAIAMNRLGGRSNTGEGGEDPARFGTERNSAIKQVASARFGVTTEYLVNASELQIKIAQGAKPGEGGQLPGHKVDEIIARTRHATPGVTLISPPPHHDIYSIEDLKQLIHDLKTVNPTATVSVKLVAEAGVGTVAAGVAKAHADLIVIAGDSGGTGASPLSSIKRAGIPWEIGLAETQQTLVLNDLRGHVRLQVDGQLKTGRDVVIGALLGAEEFGFATAPLIVEGCVMMRKCHLNTCPVGIATQDPVLRAKFSGRPEHLVNYFFFVAEEAREIMASLGFRTMDEMIGRADLLRVRALDRHWKARTLDLDALLHVPHASDAARPRRRVRRSSPDVSDSLDHSLRDVVQPALERGERVRAIASVRNVHRAVGTAIAGEVARRYGQGGLPEGTIELRLDGSAGQSFGAFAAQGMTLELEGEANDYLGKGLSGGRIVVRPPRSARLLPDGTVIVGNVVLYGATAGDVFIAGAAGERFAVRNSGATAVVEGVGDHGCEYMTGGIVVVLGATGRNFAAGMSGGTAFVLDERRELRSRCGSDQVDIEAVELSEDRSLLRRLLESHVRLTASRRGKHALAHWNETLRQFVRVMPVEYKQALRQRAQAEAARARREDARYG
jgi:glutamate synthase domain-containing protein 2/glutamate synthase domain-containing protein 1/glutamate synthase domain-containing protein 3